MALLRHSKWVNRHLPGPTFPLSTDVPSSAIRQANYKCPVGRETDASASSGDHTVGLQLSSKRRFVGLRSIENSATVMQVIHLPLAHEAPPLFCAPHEVLALFTALVKVIASDTRIAQVSHSHVILSTSSSASSQHSHWQVHVDVNRKKIKSAKILLNGNLEDFANITTPMLFLLVTLPDLSAIV